MRRFARAIAAAPWWAADLAGAAVVVAVVGALHGALLLHPATMEADGMFHSGHTWCFDHIARMLRGEVPFALSTNRIGYPSVVQVRFIGWVPALVAAPLNALFGPLAAYNLSFIACCGLAVPAMAALSRSRGATVPAATLSGVLVALSPPLLGALANGQTCKAQVWFVPALLVAADRASDGKRWGWAALTAVAVAGAFTAPTYALVLGLVLPFWVLLKARGMRGLGRAVAICLVVAVCFVAVAHYYDVDRRSSAFLPYGHTPLRKPAMTRTERQASLVGLVSDRATMGSTGSTSVTYLGVPALAAALLSLLPRRDRNARPWPAVMILVVLGVVIALGDWLYFDHSLARVGGMLLYMPDALLARLGYPLARSGEYYRAILVAWTGVALAVAVAPIGQVRALVAAVILADGFRVCAGLLPFPVSVVPGMSAWEAIRADPAPGAVLDLPLSVGNRCLGEAMLAASIHGRAVQAIPVPGPLRFNQVFASHILWVDKDLPHMEPDTARRWLRDAGFAFVTWRHIIRDGGPTLDDLERILGTPNEGDDVLWWRVAGSGSTGTSSADRGVGRQAGGAP